MSMSGDDATDMQRTGTDPSAMAAMPSFAVRSSHEEPMTFQMNINKC